MVLVIDNYDSFTFNLVQYLGEAGAEVLVCRNDEVSVAEIARRRPDRIVISPGPGRPEDAGISIDLIRTLGPRIPILGVCLGHQAIGHAFGGRVVRATRPMHGKVSSVEHDGGGVFRGITGPVDVCRYHSLVVSREGLPASLEIAATARDDEAIMALRHRTLPIHGVQFHPESILTAHGRRILQTFLAIEA